MPSTFRITNHPVLYNDSIAGPEISMTSTAHAFELLTQFCQSNHINLGGICAFTFQRNRTGVFASIIIDSEKQQVIPNYPLENMSSYKELVLPNNTLVCYQTNLPPMTESSHSGIDNPFQFPCCNNMQPYRNRRLDKEQYFTNFKNSTGSHDNAVFEVKRQINNGPMIDTTYHQIINGIRVQADGEYKQKMHAFKNYRCNQCNLFYSIDLYHATNANVNNYHHMRLNPFTKNVENLEILL